MSVCCLIASKLIYDANCSKLNKEYELNMFRLIDKIPFLFFF
jgi:hypothetical protein